MRSQAEEEELETNPGAQGLNPSVRIRSDPAFLFPQQRGFPGPHLSLLFHFLMTTSGLFPPPSLHFHCFFLFFFFGDASNAAASQQSHQPCGAASELRCSSINPPYLLYFLNRAFFRPGFRNSTLCLQGTVLLRSFSIWC